MLGLPALAALLTAGVFDVNGIVTTETRAGEAPLFVGDQPRASLVGVLTPGAELRFLDEGIDLRAGYSLRIFLQETSAVNPPPAYLHTWTLAATSRVTHRLDFVGGVTVIEGLPDYTYLPSILGAMQTTMPATLVRVMPIFSAAGNVTLQERSSRTAKLSLALSAAHHRPVGTPSIVSDAAMPGATTPTQISLPRFTSLTATPGVTFRLSRLDDLVLSTVLEYQYIAGLSSAPAPGAPASNQSLTSYTLVPTVAWRTRLARHSQLEVSAGVAFTHLVAPNPVDHYREDPVGGVKLEQRLVTRREAVLLTTLEASMIYFLDPVLATTAPRASVAAGLLLALPPYWTVALRALGSSPLTAHPLPGAIPGSPYPDEVIAGLELPVRHYISENLAIEFGGRWTDRSPFFSAPNYGFHQRQLWLYALLTATSRRVSRTATQSATP